VDGTAFGGQDANVEGLTVMSGVEGRPPSMHVSEVLRLFILYGVAHSAVCSFCKGLHLSLVSFLVPDAALLFHPFVICLSRFLTLTFVITR
jgi:hypothetical protein